MRSGIVLLVIFIAMRNESGTGSENQQTKQVLIKGSNSAGYVVLVIAFPGAYCFNYCCRHMVLFGSVNVSLGTDRKGSGSKVTGVFFANI